MKLKTIHANNRVYVLNRPVYLKPQQAETGLWVIDLPQCGVCAGSLYRHMADLHFQHEFDRIWRTHVEWKSMAPFVERLTALVKEIRRA